MDAIQHGFLTPNLDDAARWWLVAGVYSVAAVLIVIFNRLQLYRSQMNATLDPFLSGPARKVKKLFIKHEREKTDPGNQAIGV